MKNYKSIICVVAAVCLLGTAAFCGLRIYHYYAEVDEQTEAFEEIAEMVEQAPTDETVPDDAPVSEGEDVLAIAISVRRCIYRMRIWSVGFPLPARQSIIL